MFVFQRYVAAPWWDPKRDSLKKEPLYHYDSTTDTWCDYDSRIHGKQTKAKEPKKTPSKKAAPKKKTAAKAKGRARKGKK